MLVKNKIIITVFLSCFSLFFSAIAYAELDMDYAQEDFGVLSSSGVSCTRPTIGFFNGMLNNRLEAEKNFSALKVILADDNALFTHFNLPFNYALFYNNTEGISKDIQEVFRQLKQEEEHGTVTLDSRTKQDQENHEAFASEAFKQNTGLLLIGHSQGNFFLNHIYDYCQKHAPNFERARCVAIQVASPSSKSYGSQHLSNNDIIIKSFFKVTGREFRPNITIPYSSDDITGHGFIKTYLHELKAGRDHIQTMLEPALWNFCPLM